MENSCAGSPKMDKIEASEAREDDRMRSLEGFRKQLWDEEKSALTIEKYTRDVERFLRWLAGRRMTKGEVLAFKACLLERYAVTSVNSMLSSLNRYLTFCGREDCRVKTVKHQPPVFCSEERELTRAEYERLLRAAGGDHRLCLLMQTICSTGIRVSEHPFVTVEAARTGRATVRCKGKSRVVLLPRRLCRALIAYARERGIRAGSLFVTRTGKPLDRSRIWAQMKKLCRTAGVLAEKVFPHNLRHLFARTYYAMEKDVVRLADLLGHSSVNTTRIYTVESGAVHRRQIERMPLLLLT